MEKWLKKIVDSHLRPPHVYNKRKWRKERKRERRRGGQGGEGREGKEREEMYASPSQPRLFASSPGASTMSLLLVRPPASLPLSGTLLVINTHQPKKK